MSCSDVDGGNTLRNASLMGLMIFISPSNAFLIASIPAARPPFSAHSPTTLFRASADFPIISLSVSETLVQSFLASSKSPTIYSHVWVQPDWAASFKVSSNWVKVLTLVAASFASLPSAIIDLVCSSVYPIDLSCSSVKSPVNLAKVSVRTSELSHPFLSVSLKEPSFSIMSSIAIP